MRRRLGILFLLLSFFWQAIAVAGQIPVLASDEDRQHAMLHIQEAGHHHHDDGVVSLDDSSDSVLHLVSDSMPCAALDAFVPGVPTPDWASASPSALVSTAFPYPILEGLRRPPKHTA